MVAITRFPRATEAALRDKFSAPSKTGWVLDLAARSGWSEANRSYLGSMYQRGVEEMTALMDAANLLHQPTVDEALQLLERALALWAPGTTIKRRRSKRGEARVEIRVTSCPTYDRIERSGWTGVTVCGNWHHRQGWYDALGVEAEDTLLREKKWGYGTCVIRLRLRPARPESAAVRSALRARPLPRPGAFGPRVLHGGRA